MVLIFSLVPERRSACWAGLIAWVFCLLWLPSSCVAQVETDRNGFTRIHGKYVDIITDLPADEELLELPLVFEKAMPVWCQIFGLDVSDVADWHTQAFIMLDKARFDRAGLIPDAVPDFPHGFQYGNQLWVVEQPSTYYRRHLLLHEGTHWFMNRHFGQSGPPWLMEGMAEWLGTHNWDATNERLEMGIIPADKDQFPYWGRVKRIQDQLAAKEAPSLESILRYGPTAHRSVDAYAWSWAAVVFLQHHPDTQAAFQELLQQPMRSDQELARWLFDECEERWPAIRGQWRVLATDIDYGYQPSRGMLRVSDELTALDAEAVELQIEANRTWQGSGVLVSKGERIEVTAQGRYSVGQIPRPWVSEPEGVTLQYYRGQPLGKLMLRVVGEQSSEPSLTKPVETVPVGSGIEWTANADGEIHFQVNESSRELIDNEGQMQVSVRRARR